MAQERRPLVDRVTGFIEQQHRTPEQARALAQNLLNAVALKVGDGLQGFIEENAAETNNDIEYWKNKYWAEDKYWEVIEAMEPDSAHILQAVGAIREEIRALFTW